MTIYHIDAVDPDEANSSHALVVELTGTDVSVLDVGCATGYLGAALGERGCTVVGVEVDAEAAAQARAHLAEVVEADLEVTSLADALPERSFDVVVLADVLEHLTDPGRVLRDAVGLLAPGGAVVVSIPNVTHGSLRLALLEGRWEYRDTGLLDRTHLRFYDRAAVLQLLWDAGLELTDLRSTVLDPLAAEVAVDGEALPGAVVDWVRRQPDAMTYQWVARAVVGTSRRVPEVRPAVEPPRVVDEHTERAEREATLALLAADQEETVARIRDLRHRLLAARDHAVGAEAELGALRTELDRERARTAALREELHRVHAGYGEALDELAATRSSLTWRAGTALTTPAATVRRIVSRG